MMRFASASNLPNLGNLRHTLTGLTSWRRFVVNRNLTVTLYVTYNQYRNGVVVHKYTLRRYTTTLGRLYNNVVMKHFTMWGGTSGGQCPHIIV